VRGLLGRHAVLVARIGIDQLPGDEATGIEHGQHGEEREELPGDRAHPATS
jgi:hypothetical protein